MNSNLETFLGYSLNVLCVCFQVESYLALKKELVFGINH